MRGGVCRVPGRSPKVPGSAHRMAISCPSLHHRDLAPHPGTRVLDRVAWPGVTRSLSLKQGKDVLRTHRRPQRQQAVIGIGERATPADRDEAWVADLGEDHDSWTVRESRQNSLPSGSASTTQLTSSA